MNSKEKKLLAEVDRMEEEIVSLAMELVRQPSVLGEETGALEILESAWRGFGLVPERIPLHPRHLSAHPGYAPVPWSGEGRYCLTAVRPADETGGRSALFNGHVDVVSPAPLDAWETDPFTPVIRQGWLHGRGAGDMKAGVAAMSCALAAVERAGLGLRAPVTLEG